jgi:hypothetical protein
LLHELSDDDLPRMPLSPEILPLVGGPSPLDVNACT